MICAKFEWNWPSGSGEDFFEFVNVFLLFRNYLILENRRSPSYKKLEFPHSRMICAKFGWNLPSGSGEEDEHVKSYVNDDNDNNDNDDGQWLFLSENLTWVFGSGELKRHKQLWKHIIYISQFLCLYFLVTW